MGNNESYDEQLLKAADWLFVSGRDSKDPSNKSIEALLATLAIRESILGRYHQETANAYIGIFNCCRSKGERFSKLGVAAFHTAVRVLLYIDEEEGIPDFAKQFSTLKELDDPANGEKVQKYETMVKRSIQLEKVGDYYRDTSDFRFAIANYQRAIFLEREKALEYFANPVVTYLGRKIACVMGCRRPGMVDWSMADRINLEWLDDVHNGLYQSVCDDIRRGDALYADGNYGNALDEYNKASMAWLRSIGGHNGVNLEGTGLSVVENKMNDLDKAIENLAVTLNSISDIAKAAQNDSMARCNELRGRVERLTHCIIVMAALLGVVLITTAWLALQDTTREPQLVRAVGFQFWQ